MRGARYTEGRTWLLVPSESLTVVPPPTAPVFFNPAAGLNRDVTVAITAASEGSTFCDSMAGVGARGIRVANEVGRMKMVSLVDFNGDALRLARRAAKLNDVERKCEFSVSETSSYLFARSGSDDRFDFVDVDPFGTPVRQLQAGVSAASDGGILSITATDTAVLCGVYPEVSRRRYGSTPVNNRFNHETAVRILLGAIARSAAQLDVGIEPVAAHATRHYVRVFTRVRVGASKADSALRKMGYVAWCPACGHANGQSEPPGACEGCGKKAKVAGPLWRGGVTDRELVAESARVARDRGLRAAAEVLSALEGVDDFPTWCFSIEEISSSLKVATVPEDQVYRHLVKAGRRVMRTPFEKTGIKTDAKYSEVREAVRLAAHRAP